MNDCIFKEYDIRGIVGQDFLIDQAYDLAQAIATYFKQENPSMTTIIIGRDGRLHSEPISNTMIQAIRDLGFNVIDIGVTPTPALYFAAHFFDVFSAFTITASHNPKEYNGIKMWGLWGQKIQAIKKIYREKSFCSNTSGKIGQVQEHTILEDYLNYLCQHFVHLKNKSIKAVIDCGNGSAGTIVPALIKRMNWSDVKLLFEDVDGTFPNHPADPTVLENMRFVQHDLKHSDCYDIGIGFDGDGDRMNPMTKSGDLIPGDKLLALYAQNVLKDVNQGQVAKIVCDIKSSSSLIELLEQWGAHPIISPSGHSLIKEAIKRENALLAGELSCHFFFKDRYFGYDDGIYAMLRLFEILQETGKSIEDLLTIFPKTYTSPEIRMICDSDDQKNKIVQQVKNTFVARKDADTITIDGARAQMDYGWGLIRASNTQPVICLRFESQTPDGLERVKDDFYKTLTPFFDEKKLKEAIES